MEKLQIRESDKATEKIRDPSLVLPLCLAVAKCLMSRTSLNLHNKPVH